MSRGKGSICGLIIVCLLGLAMPSASATGRVLWKQRYGNTPNAEQRPAAIATSPDGSRVFVVGWGCVSGCGAWPPNSERDQGAVVAYDRAGQELWTATETKPDPGSVKWFAAAVSPDG